MSLPCRNHCARTKAPQSPGSLELGGLRRPLIGIRPAYEVSTKALHLESLCKDGSDFTIPRFGMPLPLQPAQMICPARHLDC